MNHQIDLNDIKDYTVTELIAGDSAVLKKLIMEFCVDGSYIFILYSRKEEIGRYPDIETAVEKYNEL